MERNKKKNMKKECVRKKSGLAKAICRHFVRLSGVLFIFCLLFMGTPVCTATEVPEVSTEAEDIEEDYGYSQVQVVENYQDILMLPGESRGLTFQYGEQILSVAYSSSDVNVAAVSETGVITVLAPGTATVTVSGVDIRGYAFSGTVYVYAPMLSTTEINTNIYGLTPQKDGFYDIEDEISLKYIPSNCSVAVTAQDPNLQAVYNDNYWGRSVSLKALKVGSYTVSILIQDKAFSVAVNVRSLYFTRHAKTVADLDGYGEGEETLIWREGSSMLALYKGESATLKFHGALGGEQVKWSSSDKKVATVSKSGKVTAKGYGSAVITAQTGAFCCTYAVGVSYKTAIKALRYGVEHYGSTYSQANRMKEGFYDCSSFVWRAYKAAGKYLNKNGGWAPTAAGLAEWCVKNNYMIYEGVVDVSKLLPGDLVFECDETEANGRYKGIYHVDMYQGNQMLITVERQKYLYGQLYNVMVARPCAAMGTVTAKKSGKSIKLTWGSVYGAKGYKIYRSTSKNGKYKAVATVKNGTEYKDTKAKKGVTYYYKVRPYWRMDGKTYYGKYSSVVKKKR